MDLLWLENHLGLMKVLQHKNSNLKFMQSMGGVISVVSKGGGRCTFWGLRQLVNEGGRVDVPEKSQLIRENGHQNKCKSPKVIGKSADKVELFLLNKLGKVNASLHKVVVANRERFLERQDFLDFVGKNVCIRRKRD